MFYVIGFALTSIIFIGIAVLLRSIASGKNPTVVAFVPANMHACVTTKDNEVTDATKGGGNITDVVHSIPGRRLNKSSSDQMNWKYEDDKEPRGILYRLLGIQVIGFFRYLRLNDVRTFRWGRKDGEKEYHMQSKSQQTRYVFFSGQHDVEVRGVETISILKVNLRFNVIYEETYPVRVRLRTADPYAVLTMMVNKLTINMLGGKDPKKLISDQTLQDDLAKAIEDNVKKTVEAELGITIKKVTLADIDFDEETKELLEKKTKAELEAEAQLIVAKNEAEMTRTRALGEKDAQMSINEGDADRVEKVIKPAAENELTVRVREAEAYERNQKVTVFAPGARTMVPVTPTE